MLRQFLKKHYIFMAFLLITFAICIYFYLTYFRYQPDRHDHRYYPIPAFSGQWSKTIDYAPLPHVKFKKCFLVAFNSLQLKENLAKMFGEEYYSDIYLRKKYDFSRVWHLTYEDFLMESKQKPHFLLKIYQDDKLVKTQSISFAYYNSNPALKIDNREFFITEMMGLIKPQIGFCYQFSEKSRYRLEIISDTVLPEHQEIETYLIIKPILTKY
jgi:hypothetical protein